MVIYLPIQATVLFVFDCSLSVYSQSPSVSYAFSVSGIERQPPCGFLFAVV